MLSPKPAKEKPSLAERVPLTERVTRAWWRVKSLARFTSRTVVRRRWHLFALGIYLFATNLAIGLPIGWCLTPLVLVLVLYGFWWGVRRAMILSELGREPETVRQMVAAWWRERRRVDRVIHKWEAACRGYDLRRGGIGGVPTTRKGPRRVVYPKFLSLRVDVDCDVRVVINPGAVQVRSAAIFAAKHDIAETLGCKEVAPRYTQTNGVLEVGMYWTSPLDRHIGLADLPLPGKPSQFSIGLRRDGSAMSFLINRSVLVGGLTGAGKSNLFWAMLASLLAQGVWIDLYVSDGKATELTGFARHAGKRLGHLRVVQYASSGKATEDTLFPAMIGRMAGRRKWMAERGISEITRFDETNPLCIMLVDEATLIPNQLRKGTAGELGQILTGGRAAGFVAWLATQDGRVETIPSSLRSLIPSRACFATDRPESTTAILGQAAEAQRGARCSELDLERDLGVCYAGTDASRLFEPARVPWVSPKDKALIVRGGVPPAMLLRSPADAPRPCYVYRVWEFPDAAGARRYGYTGEAYDVADRFRQHRDPNRKDNYAYCPEHRRVEHWWLLHIDESTMKVERHPTKRAAVRAEVSAIRAERPYWNRKHNWDNRWAAVNAHRPHLPRRRARAEVVEAPLPEPAEPRAKRTLRRRARTVSDGEPSWPLLIDRPVNEHWGAE